MERSGAKPTIGQMGLPELSTPERELEQLNSRERRYELGQFFTPEPVARLMAQAINDITPETVLEPGVGGAALLRAVGSAPKRFGCDIDVEAVRLSIETLSAQGGEIEIVAGDFLAGKAWPFSVQEFDAIVCNPPYIRHHNLSATEKARAASYSDLYGVQISSLSGGYVYFFLEAIARLRPGGRLAFITPTEFLDVRYGSALKTVLLEHCELEEIIVLQMDELAFEKVLTTSAITVATKRASGTRTFKLTEGSLADDVKLGGSVQLDEKIAPPTLAWTPLLPTRAARIASLTEGRTAKLGDYARIRRGIASGDNSFFCLTQAAVDEWKIENRFLVPVVVGAKDLPDSSALTKKHWEGRGAADARVWLLWCHDCREELRGTNVLRYIERGEELGVDDRFNCRTRRPWYGVEPVPPPDFFVTYMSRQRARFVRNEAGARCMTSLLNLWVKPGVDFERLGEILGDQQNAEILREFGRTYGGGLGKIEPGELRQLPVRPLGSALDEAA